MQRFITHWGQFKPCLCIVQLSGPSHCKRHRRSALVRIYLGESDRLYINPCSLFSPPPFLSLSFVTHFIFQLLLKYMFGCSRGSVTALQSPVVMTAVVSDVAGAQALGNPNEAQH